MFYHMVQPYQWNDLLRFNWLKIEYAWNTLALDGHATLAELTSSHKSWEQCGLQPHPANRSIDRSFSQKRSRFMMAFAVVSGCFTNMALGSLGLAIPDKNGGINEKGRVPGEYVDC